MVKHIILWQLKDELTEEQKQTVKAGIKSSLEALVGQIPGLTAIRVQTEGLSTSNADVMLDSAFVSARALADYAVHPAHVAAADGYVRPYTKCRLCMDYEEADSVYIAYDGQGRPVADQLADRLQTASVPVADSLTDSGVMVAVVGDEPGYLLNELAQAQQQGIPVVAYRTSDAPLPAAVQMAVGDAPVFTYEEGVDAVVAYLARTER